MRYCNLKFGYNKASVKYTALQNYAGKKKHTLANKTTLKPNGTWNVPGNLCCDQTTPWQGVYFFTNTVKVGAVWLTHFCVIILVVGIIIDYVFMKTLLILKKRAIKIGAPKFWPSYHYSSVVQMLAIGICKNYWNLSCRSWDIVA